MDPRIVDKIVQEVLASLRQGGGSVSARAGGPSRPAACCGDERGRGKQFLTAAMVRERVEGGHGLELAADEFLTPAAQDVIQQMQVTVARAAAVSPAGRPSHANSAERQARDERRTAMPVQAQITPLAAPGAFAVMVDRPGEKTSTTLTAVTREGIRLLDFRAADCPLANLQALCRAIGDGRLAGGVALLKYAADAMVLANKFRGVRAVQGTRPASVSGAVRHLAANLLVLEHEFSTFYEMRAMIRAFVTDRMLCGIAGEALAAIAAAEGW